MSIKEEIQRFRDKAKNDRLTGYPECEKWHTQLADWLEELVELRKRLED